MHSGYAAYGANINAQQNTLPGKNPELEVFIKAARLLSEAAKPPYDNQQYVKALEFNLNLWLIVQADVKSPKNKRPQDYRDKLLEVSRFMVEETQNLTNSFDVSTLQKMSAINREMVSGLSGK